VIVVVQVLLVVSTFHQLLLWRRSEGLYTKASTKVPSSEFFDSQRS
jgi:hypothetical protein